MSEPSTIELQLCLEQMKQGDEKSKHQLLLLACDRLKRLTAKMLNQEYRVHRWEETDDVFQNALVRLWKCLEEVTPETLRDFFQLAALQIRRELIDLARRHYGPMGWGERHESQAGGNNAESKEVQFDPTDSDISNKDLEKWCLFHEAVEELPTETREIVSLIFYHGWTQAEVAGLLQVSEKTIRRRWQNARLELHETLKGNLPGI